MTAARLAQQAEAWLRKLCVEIDSRRVGSAGNRAATDFFAETVAAFGFKVTQPTFDCIDWTTQGVDLLAGDDAFQAFASPYSLGCNVRGTLAAASRVAELEATDLADKVLLLYGDIAKEQVMPKSFTFYNPDEHKQLIALLEAKQPLAIIAATGRNPDLAGALYPFPLFEDGDFDLPSVYITDIEGERLADHAGQTIVLHSRATRIPSVGCNVVARKGDMARRIVFFAHIDAKAGTPGAIDNGTGVVILLLLAGLLAGYDGSLGVEIVALNGEDYYAASGEMQWLAANQGSFDQIPLGVNMDGVGYREGSTAFSMYACPSQIERAVRQILASRPAFVEGPQWYQSDHSLFVYNGVPALAFTSDDFTKLWTEIAHTPLDLPGIVDPARLVELASALVDLVVQLA